jgi:dipicolinate synthase subunit A
VEAEISKASLIAEQAGTLTDFYKKLNRFDFIFNTIPSTILTYEHLSKMKPEVTIIDIASAPGGLNHQYAAEKEIFSKLCPGLPGTYAPLSSAEIIEKTIENLLKEEAKCL